MSDTTSTPATVAPATASKPKASKPKRAHKSKKQQAKKSSVRVINDGFIERSRKPATMGTALKSRMIRVDADFAEWCRAEAMKSGVSITEVTRSLYQAMTD